MFATPTNPNDLPIEALNCEWRWLAGDAATTRTLERWISEEPTLAPLGAGLSVFLGTFRGLGLVDKDAVMVALLRRAASDGRDAALATRVIIQLMIPRVVRVTRWLSDDLGTLADRQQVALTALIDVLRQVPCDRDRFVFNHLGQELWRRMRRSVLDARRVQLAEHLVPNLDESWLDRGGAPEPLEARRGCPITDIAATPEGNAHEQLVQLLQWATHTGALDVASARLLADRCSYEGHYRGKGRSSTAGLAHQLGVNEAALRKRLSRAQQRLATAVAAAIAA